jgi:hypothetical protein
MKKTELAVGQIEELLEKASFELGHFELRMFTYAMGNGGTVVISKKTMCKITDTGINNVNKQLSKLDFKGMAKLDVIDGTVFTLTITTEEIRG